MAMSQRVAASERAPVEVIQTEQGRAVLGVVDGQSPVGIEGEEHVAARVELLQKIGYKR